MEGQNLNKDELDIKSYYKRKLNRLKKRRKIRSLKIMLTRLRILTRITCYILIIWAFFKIAGLPAWYLDKDIFAFYPNKYLEIEGNEIVTTEQVFKRLKEVTLPENPLYLIDTTPIKDKIGEMAPVKKVVVRRYWLPSRLRVVIDERTPVVSIAPTQKSDPVAVFTRDAGTVRLLEREYLPLPEYMETYRVITYDDYRKWKPAQIPYIENIAENLESAASDKLVYLDIRNPDDVYARTENFRLRIGALKGNEVVNRIKKVSPVIPEAWKIKDNISYIDLRWRNISIKLKKGGDTLEASEL